MFSFPLPGTSNAPDGGCSASPGERSVTQMVCDEPMCLTRVRSCYGEGNGTPTLVCLPGKSHGWRSLVGCRLWGRFTFTSLSLFAFMHWRRKWQPTPVFLPGESQGQRSLVGCHLWGRTESDTTKST